MATVNINSASFPPAVVLPLEMGDHLTQAEKV